MAAPRSLTLRARAEFSRWQQAKTADLPAIRRRKSPIVLEAVPVDRELERETAMWTAQLRDYINAHEDIDFYLKEFRGHICRAHSAAREVVATGVIPAGFTCPRGAPSCPFATASCLADGQALRLTLGGTARRAGS